MNDKGGREEQLTLELLDTIGKDSQVSQRGLAREMGVALGLANAYLRRCMRKGLIKISEAPANRYFYYLTPKGFAEKSRLTAKYLAHSFSFYRQAAESCRQLFRQCRANGWNRVMLCGVSDLAEIAALRAIELDIEIAAIYDLGFPGRQYLTITVCRDLREVPVDAYVLTDYHAPIVHYEQLLAQLDRNRILVPDILQSGLRSHIDIASGAPPA